MVPSESAAVNRPYFDLVVVIPLEEEVEEFTAIFELLEDHSTESTFRCTVDGGHPDISILMIQQDGMGKTHARHAASTALNDFDAGVAICLGIGGCLTDDLRLGDVCYSNNVFDVLDNAKVSDVGDGGLNMDFSPTHFVTDRKLTAAFGFMRQKKDLKPRYQQWQAERETFAQGLSIGEVKGRNGRQETLGAPRTKDGSIACASVTKSDEYNDRLKRIDRKVLAVETESAGVYEAAKGKDVPAITIRGISDHADDSKNKLEFGTSGAIRKVAAANAASFLQLQLGNPEFRNFLNGRRRTVQGSSVELQTGLPSSTRPLLDVVADAATAIDDKLRELCPEFKLQPKGYRLPVPRVRDIQLNNAIGEASRGSPVTLAEALETRRALLLRLPRTYPDYSLPWVIANDMLATELGGKQAMPVVIDGALMRAPRAGFAALATHSVADIDPSDAVQVIYIVDNVPSGSKSRLAFLESEIAREPDAKFLFISRDDAQLIELTEFANQQRADTFEICSISFLEIAHFVQKNFAMSGSEAEVVALRLRDTFEQFDLAAHPTYFAGIPKEVLSALLQANRRSELIQLAVDGFLTFLVADDRADIKLTRTTRSRFLRLLVIETNIEKRTFSQADLVEFTSVFSKRHDFAIDPLGFIQSFVDQGILHFGADGNVRFSLPFIESYLLASELHRQPDLAKRYFDFDQSDFDMSAFDLYAEIGASKEIVDAYVTHLDWHIKELAIDPNDRHILIGDAVRPVMLDNPRRMEGLQKRLRNAVDDVQNNKGDTKAKQRIIDVAERVKESAARQTRVEDDNEEATTGVAISRQLDKNARIWIIGVIFLGCGAEDLVAQVKQDLSKKLVQLGSSIAHHWTELRLTIDFVQMKSELQKDENLRQFADMNGGEMEDITDLRTLVGMLVDVMQYTLLSEPFRRVTEHLCEHARQRVLATSVEKVEFKDPIEQILHSAWLTDIESKRGKEALHKAIRALPNARFLRVNLATHFLTRVHWSHWRKEDRLVLLDAAEEAIKPLAIQFDKSGLKRAIEKAGEESVGKLRREEDA